MAAQAPPYNNTAHHNHHNHHDQSSSSSSELWRQFWAFPHSFSFCKTSSVVERLRQSRSPGMTSLRLVGVEGYQNYLTALCQALRENTTLEQVSICGSFLQQYPPPHDLHNQDDDGDDPLYPVFRAIGGLPKLTSIKLEGNEDAKVFPISLLTTMLSACCGRPTKVVSLQEFTCHYVDLVGTPGEWQNFGQALHQLARAGNLQSVTMMNIQILVQQPTTNPTRERYGLLDAILSNLSHCPHVELGWRQRHNHHATADNDSNNHNGVGHELISPVALQKLLLGVPFDNHPSCHATTTNNATTNNINNVLRQLTLGRRIPLQYSPHLSTILECLQVPPALSSLSSSCTSSLLQELQLDNIHFSTSHEVALLWQQMAAMLECNTALQSVDLTFASTFAPAAAPTPMTNGHNNVAADDQHRNNVATAANSMTTIMMDLALTTVMTKALAVNKTLKRLCLRGGGAGAGTSSMAPNFMATSCQKMWLTLLEQHNYTLEELVLFEDDFHPPTTDTTSATAPKSQDHPTDEYHEKMQFYLRLNRQPVKLGQQNNGNNDNDNNKLRALLHNSNGALAPEHILPCLEAAMEIQNNANFHEHNHSTHSHTQAVIGPSTLFDSWFDRDFVEDDYDDDDDVFGASTAASRRHHPNKHIGDISGLYYLLSQHPCILLNLQERLSKINDNPKTTPGTQLTNDTKDDYKKASIPLGGGASPQLLLLDDDIVALW